MKDSKKVIQDSAVADRAAERFASPRKAFIEPSKPMVFPTLNRPNQVGIPMSQRSGLPPLNLAKLGVAPKNVAPKVSTSTVTSTVVRTVTSASVSNASRGKLLSYSPEHVLTDEEFIIRTRAHSIHDPGMKELFAANGGEDMYEDYGTLAQAFEALRRVKLARIAGVRGAEYVRTARLARTDCTVYSSVRTAEETRIEREAARAEAIRRAENHAWLTRSLSKKTA